MNASSSSCTPENVEAALGALGFAPGLPVCGQLAVYLELLNKWNRVMNLVGPSDWRRVLETLAVDSFHLAPFLQALPLPDAPLCRDLGAGAGLPGIPLRMLWQQGDYTLVEAREKRALFLRAALAAVPLPRVSVFQGRAEQFLAGSPPAQLTLSRAFMPWARLLALVKAHTEPGGLCVFLTLEPLPASLPEGWRALAGQEYSVGGSGRFFWALQRM